MTSYNLESDWTSVLLLAWQFSATVIYIISQVIYSKLCFLSISRWLRVCGANDHNYAYCNSNLGESDGALLLSSKQKISTMMMHNDNSTI